ncbi:MAG: NAD(P)-dependent alcohol dehydrogenase [Desulfomonile tiedjei]|nr:NAD(P)-dependent alcohol dehydrogenase [Desulfomonile tiedjei]
MKLYRIEKEFGIDELKLVEDEVPKPGHQQVVVKMKATSINYRDLLMINGLYSRNLSLPLIPFSDGAGEVVAIGDGVTRWKQGDRVMSTFFQNWISGPITDAAAKSALGGAVDGVLAEDVALHEDGLVAIPEHLSFEEGATLPCAALAAWHALNTGGFTCGETVLTLGTGGVSVFAVQFGKAAGARIVGTSSSDEKLKRLKEMGVAEVINYRTEPDWDEKVLELTGGKGVDRVIEVGGAGTLAKSLRAVRVGGLVSLIGVLTGQSGEVNPLPAIMKSIRIQGIFVGSREMQEAMVRAVSVHRIRPVIDKIFPFSDVKEALRYMASGAHFGKVVVRF